MYRMAQALHIPRLARTQAEPLLATIGNTPLLRLDKIAREFPDIEIFGKAEYFNPGGSVKDRAALNMVLDGERSGTAEPAPHHPGRHQRQYRHRLRHDRRQPRLSREAGAAGERLRGAQAHPAGVRRGDGVQRRRTKARTAPSACAARSTWRIRTRIFTPINTTIRPTGRRISRAPGRRSSSRPAAR